MADRTDIHRPGAIIPLDYTFVGITTARWEYGAWPRLLLAEAAKVRTHMTGTGGQYATHQHGGNCMSCGAHCFYLSVFYHPKSNEYIATGMDCAAKLNMGDRNRFKKFTDVVEAARHHCAGKRKAQGLLKGVNLDRAWELYANRVALPQDELEFHNCIKAAPQDAFAWAVYGDWLEEQGRVADAARIRSAGGDLRQLRLPPAVALDGPVAELVKVIDLIVKYGHLWDRDITRLRKALAEIDGTAPAAPAQPGYLKQLTKDGLADGYALWQRWQGKPELAQEPYAVKTICDIIGRGQQYGHLTAKQTAFCLRLLGELNQQTEKEYAAATKAQPKAAPPKAVEDMTVTLALFKLAQTKNGTKEGLQRPKVNLQLANGSPVRLAVAGQRSKYAGQIMVTDGGAYGNSKWFGVIRLDGTWHGGQDETPEVLALVRKFGEDPVGVAVAYGKATGCCCFCGIELTDPQSTQEGYGPICSEHYALPWGPYANARTKEKRPRPSQTVQNMKMAKQLGDTAAAMALQDYELEHGPGK